MHFVSTQVLNSTILQQQFTVEYVIHHQMCDECQRREAKDYWKAVCQVRQKVKFSTSGLVINFSLNAILPFHIYSK